MSKQKKFILQENDIPTQWYNIQADMVNKPLPPLNPKTKQPVTAEDLSHIFSLECSKQELDTEHRWIDIPEEVLDKYKYYRSTPLVRAYALEKALDTPAHIYFKNESVNPLGSHKLNSALAQ
ncbi:MAG: TrpB-like pyridoxal-phosphate dependent enzyme, partial [Prevotella buccalis]|nr:TrpB-like pyridoxal-phosphate dependent enzyme [Hoylesella buccalis]